MATKAVVSAMITFVCNEVTEATAPTPRDTSEQRPTQPRHPQTSNIAPRHDVPAKHGGSRGVEQDQRRATPGNAERRKRADAEDQ
jgi:hypothetical protein